MITRENVTLEEFFEDMRDTMCGGDTLKVETNEDGSQDYKLYGYGQNLLCEWNDCTEEYVAY